MTLYDRPRTDPIASHAYTLPVVREVPIGSPADSDVPPATPTGRLRGRRARLVSVVLSPVTIAERSLRDTEQRPSQRRLVALSLLRCPDRER